MDISAIKINTVDITSPQSTLQFISPRLIPLQSTSPPTGPRA